MAQVPVPNVVGMVQSEAEKQLNAGKLTVGPITPTANPNVAIGLVISSKPSAGQTVEEQTSIELFVSSGGATVSKSAVPTLANMTPDEARAKLTKEGLKAADDDTPEVSDDIAAGKVIRSDPAAGTEVEKDSTVALIVSVGKPVQVAVPNVVGLTTMAAEAALKGAGLVLGVESSIRSHAIPAGGVISSTPPAGTVVNQTSKVKIEVSSGELFDIWQYRTTMFFGALGLLVVGVIVRGLWGTTPAFFASLRETEVARGLITFLIAISTIAIALILTLSTIMLKEHDNARDRFDRGKQILTTMIGVLGTIVGFYFGSLDREGKQLQGVQITTSAIPDGKVGQDYGSVQIGFVGGTPPLKWTVSPALPAGLTLNAETGQITGTPTEPKESIDYKVTVRDNSSPQKSNTVIFKLLIEKKEDSTAAPKAAPTLDTTKVKPPR